MKFTRQTSLKTALEVTGPGMSALATAPVIGAITKGVEAYCAFLQGKGGQGGKRAHTWEVKAALQCIFRERPVIIDGGAAVGQWSQTFLDHRPDARMVMIEPQPSSYAAIERLALPGATLLPSALGDQPGTATLHAPKEAAVVASFHKRRDSRWKDLKYDSFEVPVTTVSEIARAHELDFIDFLKMDIEGHELAALRGAEDLMARSGLGGIAFEFGPGNVNSRTMFVDFFELLDGFGFEIFRVRPGGGLLPIPRYDEDCEFYSGTCNYVARLRDHPYHPRNGGAKS
jgi:FkbM family methyltransferase